jgi:cathepsin F
MAGLYSKLTLILASQALAKANATAESFEDFTSRFHRTYATEAERILRRNAFEKNMAYAAQLQEKNPTATYGMTTFSDKTDEELLDLFPALYLEDQGVPNLTMNFTADGGGPPDSFDAQSVGAVTPIKDQGHCNSCWAHVVAAVLETGVSWQHNGKLVDLSPQELVDCDTRDGGCNNGNMDKALTWMEEMSHGLEPLSEYPYTGKVGTCQMSRAKEIVSPRTHYRLHYPQMAGACFEFGALAVGVNAGPIMLNTGGLIDLGPNDCNPNVQTHAVTIIGYGKAPGNTLFWRFKNSWGEIWGSNGFGKIRRGANTCGIETFVIGTKVAKPTLDTVVV